MPTFGLTHPEELNVSTQIEVAAEPVTLTRWEIQPRDGHSPIRGETRVLAGTKPRSAVVICHGFKGFKNWGFFPPLARSIARQGHAAISFDFSRNGVGPDGVDFSALDQFAGQTHSRNVDEIQLVVDALIGCKLLERCPRSIGLFGHSRGGGEGIIAASEDPRVDALVTWAGIAAVERWSDEQVEAWERGETVEITNARTGQQMPVSPAYWQDVTQNQHRLDIVRAAETLRVPWLIVHGEADTSVSPTDARVLFDAAREETDLLLIENADHTFGARHPFVEPTPELEAATEATLEWFNEHLK